MRLFLFVSGVVAGSFAVLLMAASMERTQLPLPTCSFDGTITADYNPKLPPGFAAPMPNVSDPGVLRMPDGSTSIPNGTRFSLGPDVNRFYYGSIEPHTALFIGAPYEQLSVTREAPAKESSPCQPAGFVPRGARLHMVDGGYLCRVAP